MDKRQTADLVLGTAQLGLAYGAANTRGQPDESQARLILRAAANAGVRWVDTAAAYGSSEARIGTHLPAHSHCRVVTKLAPLDELNDETPLSAVLRAVEDSVRRSCNRLRSDRLDVLLLHRAHQLTWRGGDMGQVEEGDQIYPGMPVLKVVDPASMQVEANINQAQSSELRIGQKVRIGFDAFTGLELTGHVYSIGALASSTGRSQYFIRQVPVRIAIDKLDPRVIPDLSTHADVITAYDENVLSVPLPAVTEENGKSYVYVKSANGFEKRAVTLGFHSNTQVAIKEGLRDGDEVRVN